MFYFLLFIFNFSFSNNYFDCSEYWSSNSNVLLHNNTNANLMILIDSKTYDGILDLDINNVSGFYKIIDSSNDNELPRYLGLLCFIKLKDFNNEFDNEFDKEYLEIERTMYKNNLNSYFYYDNLEKTGDYNNELNKVIVLVNFD
jgi:hypothetical protein